MAVYPLITEHISWRIQSTLIVFDTAPESEGESSKDKRTKKINKQKNDFVLSSASMCCFHLKNSTMDSLKPLKPSLKPLTWLSVRMG